MSTHVLLHLLLLSHCCELYIVIANSRKTSLWHGRCTNHDSVSHHGINLKFRGEESEAATQEKARREGAVKAQFP
jgi:hypothetical protein